MTETARPRVFVVSFRIAQGAPVVESAIPTDEFTDHLARYLALRSRFNPDMRSMLLAVPPAAGPQQVLAACGLLSADERLRLYQKAVHL